MNMDVHSSKGPLSALVLRFAILLPSFSIHRCGHAPLYSAAGPIQHRVMRLTSANFNLQTGMVLWNSNGMDKREKTLRERGIDFVDAVQIWKDPRRQERVDYRSQYGEKRFQTIGVSKLGLLFVVYTERVYENGAEVIRIISVRKANKRDKQDYASTTFHARLII